MTVATDVVSSISLLFIMFGASINCWSTRSTGFLLMKESE
jgi:hypothetical protein